MQRSAAWTRARVVTRSDCRALVSPRRYSLKSGECIGCYVPGFSWPALRLNGLLLSQMAQPIPVNAHGLPPPLAFHTSGLHRGRKKHKGLLAAIHVGPYTHKVEAGRRMIIEIIFRHFGIPFPLLSQI